MTKRYREPPTTNATSRAKDPVEYNVTYQGETEAVRSEPITSGVNGLHPLFLSSPHVIS